jgi:putative transposase
MARPLRNSPGGYCYHVLSRGNARQRVFRKPADYEAFVGLFDAAHEVVPMRLLAYCLMPNHFHLVLWPREDGDLSRWMQWLLTTHVRRYHEHHHTTGHVWQGRFKSFPIQADEHLLTVLRYVERNSLRADLVKAAALWPHSSLRAWNSPARPKWYSEGPVKRGKDWLKHVNQPQSEGELLALRRSVERGIPYGGERWQQKTVTALGLESTLRSRGRPRKQNNEA